MVEYSKLVTTEKGQALMIKMLTRTEKIKYTKICASNEKYNEGQLESLTTLDDIRQTGVVSKLTQVDEVTIKVETAFTNTGLDDGYYMRTLGLYALDPDIGEILYAVCIASDDNCYMPPDNGKASTGVYINMYQRVEVADNVLLNVDSGVFATIGDIQELTQLLNSHTENTDNPHNVTKQQLGLGDVDNTSDLNKPVSVPVQEALDAYYAQLTAYTDKEIADLIDGAPTTLDTLKELADAINDNKSIQEALDAAIGEKANQNEFDSHVATVASSTASGHVKVDNALSSTSTNPVQNKIINNKIEALGNSISNLAESLLQRLSNHIDTYASTSAYGHVKVDNALNLNSTNPVQNNTITNAFNAIGKVESAVCPNFSLGSGVGKAITYLTLAPGVWIIVGNVNFTSNSTGVRQVNILNTAGYTAGGVGARTVQVSACNNSSTQLATTQIANISANTTYNLNCLQTSGTTLVVSGALVAVKIK